MDFDTPLPPPKEYTRLPEGDAAFEIIDMKRTRRPVGRLGEISIAELHLQVTPSDGSGVRKLVSEVKLHEELAFLLYQFAASIGQYEHGSGKAISIDWGKVPGSSGFCVIKHRTYKNKDNEDRVAVDVDKWLDPQGRASSQDKPRQIIIEDMPF